MTEKQKPANKSALGAAELKNYAMGLLAGREYGAHELHLKLQARATLVDVPDADPDIVARFAGGETPAERILTLDIVALDWNCPKYIPTLYSEDALRQIVGPQIGKLQAENAALKAELAALRGEGGGDA